MKKLYHFLLTSYKLRVTRFKRFTSHLLPHTSYLSPLTSHLLPHTSYLIPLFAFCIFSAQAQPYQSIFGKEKTEFYIFTWITCFAPDPGHLGCGNTHLFTTTSKDTISINGLLYQGFNPHPYWESFEAFVREDTMTGRIYRYIPELEKELLICDMNLNVGDTFQLYIEWFEYAMYDILVKKIDTIEGRKVIEFNDISGLHSLYGEENKKYNIDLRFMEGIGPIYGPFGYLGEHYSSLEFGLGVVLCVHRDDTLYYMTSELLGCMQFGDKINEFESQVINIYPNPANDFIRIEINDDKIGGKLFLLNSIGMVVYQGNVENNLLELNVSHLSAGFYSVLYETSRERSVSKFIKMK